MNKNNLILISLALLALIFGTYYILHIDEMTLPENFVTYTNDTYGFSISYPAHLELRENTGQFEAVRISRDPNNLLDSGVVIYVNPPIQEITSIADIKKFLDQDSRIDKKTNPLYKSSITSINGIDAVVMTGVDNVAGGAGYQVFTLLNNNSILQLSGNDIPGHHVIFSTLHLK